MKGDEGEPSPFKKSTKVVRSPGVGPQGETGGEADASTKKRKERSGKTPEKSLEKRSRKSPVPSTSELTETESEDVSVAEVTDLESAGCGIAAIWQATSEIKHWLSNQYKSKRISIVSYDEIIRKITRIRKVSSEMVNQNAYLEGRLAERARMEDIVETKMEAVRMEPSRKTFAEVVNIPKITGFKRVAPSPKVLMIQSKEEGKEPDDVKKMLKETISPGQMGINIRRVRKTARGVMVEMENEEQVKRIEQNAELVSKGLVVERMRKKKPRVMIYDIDDDLANEDVVKNIYEQNLVESDITLDQFQEEFQCVHKFGHRTDQTRKHWVAECSARVRNELRRRERLYVGWQCCRIKDYNPLVRCYQCQAFGHVAKFCKNKLVCPHCSGEHDRNKCPSKDRPGICANCKFAGRNFHHETGDRECPELERATKIAIERVDYGN